MFGFGKKKPADPGADVADQVLVPVDLNAAHSYVAPGPRDYPSPPVFGATVYATQLGTELPTLRDQDRILTHYYSPRPTDPPQAFYEDRNRGKLVMGRGQELFQTNNWQDVAEKPADAVNPWHNTPPSTRPTSTQSPSNYRFVRPFDQRFVRTLNGEVGSMASLGRAYPVGGMAPAPNHRNTFRITPPSRDTENYDLASATTPAAQPAVYVSPQVNTPQASRWRLM